MSLIVQAHFRRKLRGTLLLVTIGILLQLYNSRASIESLTEHGHPAGPIWSGDVQPFHHFAAYT
jgi:hypothetical protein